jgi:hypothetical protein
MATPSGFLDTSSMPMLHARDIAAVICTASLVRRIANPSDLGVGGQTHPAEFMLASTTRHMIATMSLLNPSAAGSARALLADGIEHSLGGAHFFVSAILIADFRLAFRFRECLRCPLLLESMCVMLSLLGDLALARFLLPLSRFIDSLLTTDAMVERRTGLPVVPCTLMSDALLVIAGMANHEFILIPRQLTGIATGGEAPIELGLLRQRIAGQDAVVGGKGLRRCAASDIVE